MLMRAGRMFCLSGRAPEKSRLVRRLCLVGGGGGAGEVSLSCDGSVFSAAIQLFSRSRLALPCTQCCISKYIYRYTVKKVCDFSIPSRDVNNQTLSGREYFNYLIIPGQEEFG
jgi:hypothetical protein